jgi:sigma-B regulation protein RsbU (phosphoserine phosphatase)
MAISRQLSSTFDLDALLNQIIDAVIELVGSEAAAISLADANECELCFAATSAVADPNGALTRVVLPLGEDSITGWVVTRGEAQIVEDVTSDPRKCCTVDEESGFETHNLLSVPLWVQDTVIGAVNAINKKNGQPWTEDDVQTLQDFANQAAIAIQNAMLFQEELERKRLEEELKVARQIQSSLLPKAPPAIPGWDFAAVYRSARPVGGDFYDFFSITNDVERLGMVIADVSDKGVPAALFMAASRTIIRTTATVGDGPARTLMRANRLAAQDSQTTSQFVTVFYATLEPHSGQLVYANAGHNRPLWWEAATEQIHELAAKGIALGVIEEIELEERAIDVGMDDVIVFYTDGVTEAMKADDEGFGVARLRETLASHTERSAQDILEAVVEAVDDFVGGASQSDDCTIFVVKRLVT